MPNGEEVGLDEEVVQAIRNDARLEAAIELDADTIGQRRSLAQSVIENVGASNPTQQLAFLRSLLENPEEATAFRENPKQYAVDHGVLLDPALVRTAVDAAVFDAAIDRQRVETFGPEAVQELLAIRRDAVNPRAVPAAVAAGAAVVMAAAAVVTMVVTLVRVERPQDLIALKGLIRPGGPMGPEGPGVGPIGPMGPEGPMGPMFGRR